MPRHASPTYGVTRDAGPADRIPQHAVPADRVPGQAVPADRRLASLRQVGETDEAVWHQPAIRRADAASEARRGGDIERPSTRAVTAHWPGSGYQKPLELVRRELRP